MAKSGVAHAENLLVKCELTISQRRLSVTQLRPLLDHRGVLALAADSTKTSQPCVSSDTYGSSDLPVMDSSAGAIPSGLAPQVDVLWEVMSQNSCSDVFGRRVGESSYCVQVAIGNNSGHPLQLAGIGFTNRLEALAALGNGSVTIANNSYASTRAVLVREQTWNGRNVLYHSTIGKHASSRASNLHAIARRDVVGHGIVVNPVVRSEGR